MSTRARDTLTSLKSNTTLNLSKLLCYQFKLFCIPDTTAHKTLSLLPVLPCKVSTKLGAHQYGIKPSKQEADQNITTQLHQKLNSEHRYVSPPSLPLDYPKRPTRTLLVQILFLIVPREDKTYLPPPLFGRGFSSVTAYS